MCTLIPQLIDVVASDFVLPVPSPQVDPAQPLGLRGRTSQVPQGYSTSRVATFDLVCFSTLFFSLFLYKQVTKFVSDKL